MAEAEAAAETLPTPAWRPSVEWEAEEVPAAGPVSPRRMEKIPLMIPENWEKSIPIRESVVKPAAKTAGSAVLTAEHVVKSTV